MSTKDLKAASNKRWIIALLVCIVFVLAFSLTISERAYAADVIDSGTYGTFTWSLDSDGVLTISGTGSVSYFDGNGYTPPWYNSHRMDIKTIIINEGITKIDYEAFQNHINLTSVHIPESVTMIDNFAFSGCTSLIDINLPDNLTILGYSAFKNCSSLTGITLPDSLQRFGDKTVYYAEGMNGDELYYGPFIGCSNLIEVNIPEGIKEIPNRTFYGCSSLTSIYIHEGITKIGLDAFDGCNSLNKVYFDSWDSYFNMQYSDSYSSHPTANGADLYIGGVLVDTINVPDSFTSINIGAFKGCKSIKNITIPESVTNIQDYAFSDCRSLTKITIPNSVTKIGSHILDNCRSLKSITIPFIGGSDIYYDYKYLGFLFGASKFYENPNCVPVSLEEVIITGDINEIPDDAFYNCNKIKKIVLPDSITRIGYESFYGCSSLNSINIPVSVTSIDGLAFDSCSSLSSIFIPESVTSIADNSFDGCTSLNDIYVVEGSYTDSWLDSNGFEDQARYVTKSGDHYYYERIAAQPTCEQPGSKETFCVVCGDATSESIPALGHDLKHHEGQAATCTEPGWYEYDTCSRCNYSTYVEIPFTSHDFAEVLTKATLTKDGSVKYVCTKCGAEDPDAESIIISHPAIYLLYSTSYTYSGSAKKLSITIEDADEQIIDESNYTVTYLNNVNVGTAIAKVTFNGEFYSGSKSLKYHITPKDLSKTKISLSSTSYTYDGAVKKPTVSVKDTISGETVSLEEGTDYTVTYASGRKSVGTYKVTIKGEGNYTGTVTKTFKINPKGTTLKTLTATSKGFKATWTKQATKMSTSYITGYEIQYSTSSTFASGNKTVTVAKYSTVSKTISNLTAKKKYYVRIRTYMTVSGVKYYSPWSAKKYVTTKA